MTDASFALPELFIALAGMALLLFGAARGEKSAASATALTLVSFLIAGVLLFALPKDGVAFRGFFIADAYARFVKALLLVGGGFALALSPAYWRRLKQARADYPGLILFALLGMMIMVSAYDLLSLYVGLELQNLCLYGLASFRRDDHRSHEAGLKYFVLSAVSSAILLFGASFLYGFAGTTNFAALAEAIALPSGHNPGIALGLAFVLAGLAFKISAVPFHMWTPDVYEGAPTPVTVFFAVAPKIAALSLLARLLTQPLGGMVDVWRPLVTFLAVASMLLGGFGGLLQTNLKRLMAYSAMANIGALLVGIAAFQKGEVGVAGIQGLLLYLALYFTGVLGVFGVMLALRKGDEPIEDIADLAGLSKTHPPLALALGACVFSLAGIPPLAGFFGKYFVFLAAVKAGQIPLALIGVTASVVAAGYYLRLAKTMFFDEPGPVALDPVPSREVKIVTAFAALTVSFFIVMPAPLLDAAQRAAESLMS